MRIAIEGCAHGELDKIYDTVLDCERRECKKIDLLICCGDFQSVRNDQDLKCMAVPDKFKNKGSFYKYYSGEKLAPVLTIFIGGNHEASNYLQELAYGGWVAPNIYYLGYASVINVAGIRIGGISGIYKSHDFMKGHHEYPPYNDGSVRSVYHTRNLEVFRLKQLSGKLDIFISHDWPSGIAEYGNLNALLRIKPFFQRDIETNNLGSPPLMEILRKHHPTYWFAAHLHCRFDATVKNQDKTKTTTFLALDKCLPRRKYFEFIDIEHDTSLPINISYDKEWLTILYLTNHLLSIKNGMCYMPGVSQTERYNFTPTQEEKQLILKKFNSDLTVPMNFQQSVSAFSSNEPLNRFAFKPNLAINNQTTEFCEKLDIHDPFELIKKTPDFVQTQAKQGHMNQNKSCPTKANNCTRHIDSPPASIKRTPLVMPPAKNRTEQFSNEVADSNKKDVECLHTSAEIIDNSNLGFFIDTLPTPLLLPPVKNQGTSSPSDAFTKISLAESNKKDTKHSDISNQIEDTSNLGFVIDTAPTPIQRTPLVLPPAKNYFDICQNNSFTEDSSAESNKIDIVNINSSEGVKDNSNFGFFIDTSPTPISNNSSELTPNKKNAAVSSPNNSLSHSSGNSVKRTRGVLTNEKYHLTNTTDVQIKRFKRRNEASYRTDESDLSM
ncbi:hypothetical protein TKK_0000676 [Trichogramma kaykai]|uniref:Lariat debranching enzyme C-terminal domain-containing protein n=1 Tax=Trichogramma kaykai TaxID=54128 RepID=A0ABD2VZP6_9HYME